MSDYSRGPISKNSRQAFYETAEKIIGGINELKGKYDEIWAQLEVLRKQRAAIIENVIGILKNNGIKPTKPLGRCNNDEIIEELSKIVDDLPFKDREEVQVAIVRINNRYQEIAKLGSKLDKLSHQLYEKNDEEPDKGEEVSFSTVNDKTEEVVNRSVADSELVKSLDKLLKSKRNVVSEKPQLKQQPLLNMEEDVEALTDEIMRDVENDNVAKLSDEDYLSFTIRGNQTLAEIAKNVYGDEDYWEYIYNYQDNKDKIDSKLETSDLPIDEAADTIGLLSDLELKFPRELVIYELDSPSRLGKVA